MLRSTVPELRGGGRDCQLQRHRLMQKAEPTMVRSITWRTENVGGGAMRDLEDGGLGMFGWWGLRFSCTWDVGVREAIKANNAGG